MFANAQLAYSLLAQLFMASSTSPLFRSICIIFPACAVLMLGCGQRKPTDGRSSEVAVAHSNGTEACLAPSSGEHRLQSLRDVRVLDFDGTKMFVPKSWLRGYLDDGRSQTDVIFRSIAGKAIKPSINSNECPGAVHYFQVGERAARHGGMTLWAKAALPLTPAAREALQGSVVQVFVGARRPEDIGGAIRPNEDVSQNPQAGWLKLHKFPSYIFKGGPGEPANGCTAEYDDVDFTWVLYRWVTPAIGIGLVVPSDAGAPKPEWESLCAMTESFYTWLTTEPARRKKSSAFGVGQ
jgi:hypothetical protein